jgi:hypothetical protein
MFIGCTQKLSREIKSCLTTYDYSQAEGILGWHGNLYRFYRRKSVLLINNATRFAVLIPGLVKNDFSNFDNIFRTRLKQELLWAHVSNTKVAEVLLSLGPIQWGKSHSRSVLGTMKDMAHCIEVQLKRLGRLPDCDEELLWISKSVNDMPCNFKDHPGYFYPKREIHRLLASSTTIPQGLMHSPNKDKEDRPGKNPRPTTTSEP